MGWRIISIQSPSRLSLKNRQLCIEQEELVSLPIEDIDTLILDSPAINISSTLMAELAEQKVTVILCNDKHLPVGTLMPYEPHSRQMKMLQMQMKMSLPLKKRLWQKIIQMKIFNQGEVLKLLKLSDKNIFLSIVHDVKSGDSDNREAYAAKLYFNLLLKGETRNTDIWFNSAVNYAYAIVRSILARQIAAYGFLSSLGVFHKNELNNFNLADDFIEPYRPFIDYAVYLQYQNKQDGLADLQKEDKIFLIDILNKYVKIDEKNHVMKYSCELMVASFSKAIVCNDESLLILPMFTSKFANDLSVYENFCSVRPSDND